MKLINQEPEIKLMKIATGLAVGLKAEPELAAAAVLSGMSKGELDASACVLLF
ncbi:hypothetical protein MCEMSEM29_01617 [Methylophilaceae bacterium]